MILLTKPFVTVKFYLNGDESGQLYTTEFESGKAYDEWYEDMKKSIDLFDEIF
jgi:hypothetical protein